MSGKYHEQNVTVMIRHDSELYRRAVKMAAEQGVTVEKVIDSAVFIHGDLALERWLEKAGY